MKYKQRNERHRIVVHFRDGRLLKGCTYDFIPANETFHLTSEKETDKGRVYEINCADLKAIFFVKTLRGDKKYAERKRFEEVEGAGSRGLKIRVEFPDGEIIRGTSYDYSDKFKGFFIIPVDPKGNNEKVYVITDAAQDVKIGDLADG